MSWILASTPVTAAGPDGFEPSALRYVRLRRLSGFWRWIDFRRPQYLDLRHRLGERGAVKHGAAFGDAPARPGTEDRERSGGWRRWGQEELHVYTAGTSAEAPGVQRRLAVGLVLRRPAVGRGVGGDSPVGVLDTEQQPVYAIPTRIPVL